MSHGEPRSLLTAGEPGPGRSGRASGGWRVRLLSLAERVRDEALAEPDPGGPHLLNAWSESWYESLALGPQKQADAPGDAEPKRTRDHPSAAFVDSYEPKRLLYRERDSGGLPCV